MGIYINPGNDGFKDIINSEYVDKTGLACEINKVLNTSRKLTCITRPRRFGKSFAEKMLCAYYDCSCRSEDLFKGYDISRDESYEKHLNKYNVLFIDVTGFYQTKSDDVVRDIIDKVSDDLRSEFTFCNNVAELNEMLQLIIEKTGRKIVCIIDEWDAIFREEKSNETAQKAYIALLRGLFKNGNLTDKVFAGVYMTGILPIKKYGTQSAVSDFKEYTMLEPGQFAEFFGFTSQEVEILCHKFGMSYLDMRNWYDGYSYQSVGEIYNPNSVMEAVHLKKIKSYWAESETYASLREYISLNFDGLRDSIRDLLGGNRLKVNVGKFQNDMVSVASRDDVLTLLIHLGYLAYDEETESVRIPNQEIIGEFVKAIEDGGWENLARAISLSDELLEATLNCDNKTVERILEEVHEENTSIIEYNDENSLSCVISIAYFSARNKYKIIRELPTGKGYADLVFLPLKNGLPFIVELKWDKSAESAISQIKNKNYYGALQEYKNALAVGINYDKKTKKHNALIEPVVM